MIWLIGNKGMLGTEVSQLLASRDIAFIGSDREVDILNPVAVAEFVAGKSIQWVINCAAYTAVDKAEYEEELALALNAEGPENIARLCTEIGARLLHISTDYVFSGEATGPYLETDKVAPTGAYGRTKAEGERRIMKAAPDSVIVRTAWLYGKHGPNFVYTMLKLMGTKDEIGVVADQQGTPTWARDLATAIVDILSFNTEFLAGIYHYTNAGQTNWHEFAQEIQNLGIELGLLTQTCCIKALRTDQYPTKARRPAYSVLSKEKIMTSGISVPEWRKSLKAFLTEEKAAI